MLSMLTVLPLSVPGAGTFLGWYSLVSNRVLMRVDLPRPDSPDISQSLQVLPSFERANGEAVDQGSPRLRHAIAPKDRAQLTNDHSDELESAPEEISISCDDTLVKQEDMQFNRSNGFDSPHTPPVHLIGQVRETNPARKGLLDALGHDRCCTGSTSQTSAPI